MRADIADGFPALTWAGSHLRHIAIVDTGILVAANTVTAATNQRNKAWQSSIVSSKTF